MTSSKILSTVGCFSLAARIHNTANRWGVMRKSWSLSFESIWFKRCLTSAESDRLFIAQGDKDISYLKRTTIQNLQYCPPPVK
jgi:hypothetical protein